MIAAGLGSRLGELTATLPKPLVTLAGRPLVGHTLKAVEAAGVDECLIVTGYREALVRDALAGRSGSLPVGFVSNAQYWRRASSSLAVARDACGREPFLLLMSDHAMDASLIHGLREQGVAQSAHGCSVAADYGARPARYVREATKLQVGPDGRVTGIGKAVTGWQALDAGAFYCTPDVWVALDAVGHDADLSDVFGWLASRGRLRAADITGSFWYDIDTDQDLAEAEALMRVAAGVGSVARREEEDLAPA